MSVQAGATAWSAPPRMASARRVAGVAPRGSHPRRRRGRRNAAQMRSAARTGVVIDSRSTRCATDAMLGSRHDDRLLQPRQRRARGAARRTLGDSGVLLPGAAARSWSPEMLGRMKKVGDRRRGDRPGRQRLDFPASHPRGADLRRRRVVPLLRATCRARCRATSTYALNNPPCRSAGVADRGWPRRCGATAPEGRLNGAAGKVTTGSGRPLGPHYTAATRDRVNRGAARGAG